MPYKLEEDFQYSILELFYLTSHQDLQLRNAWCTNNIKSGIQYHWGDFVDIISIRSILEKGRNKENFRKKFNVTIRWFLDNYIIEPYPLDDNPSHTKYIIADVGKRHYEHKTLLYIIEYPSQIIEDFKNSIVMIYDSENGNAGSGFIYKDNYVVTAYHVLEGISSLAMKLENGEQLRLVSKIVPKEPKKYDVAIIEIEPIESYSKSFHLEFNTQILQEVLIMGYPRIPQTRESYLVYNKGEISAYVDNFNGVTGITLTTFLRGGNSGGPVIDKFGSVVGIVSEYLFEQAHGEEAANESLGISFIVPSSDINKLLNGEL